MYVAEEKKPDHVEFPQMVTLQASLALSERRFCLWLLKNGSDKFLLLGVPPNVRASTRCRVGACLLAW